MIKTLEYFDTYVSVGLRPIAIFRDTKCPIGKKWNKDWSKDRWRPYFLSDSHNMGILLGDIIDVEADTIEANNFLLSMIDEIPHPMFSSSKSIHHLFLSPDKNLTRCVFDGIEFRGKFHQSVVPPSLHSDGSFYKWLSIGKFPPPILPKALSEFYFSNIKTNTKKLKVDCTKSECKICNNKFWVHKKRLVLEVRAFKEFNLPWMCHNCREIDIKESCRNIRKVLRQDRKFVI